MKRQGWFWVVVGLAACEEAREPQRPLFDVPRGGEAGTSARGGAEATAGATEQAGGDAGEAAARPCDSLDDCPTGQTCTDDECGCPEQAPDYCAAEGKCVALDQDGDHCGSCEHACRALQVCASGTCGSEATQIVSLDPSGELALQRVGSVLYLLSGNQGVLWRLDLPVSGEPTQIAGGMGGAFAFRIDGAYGYVASNNSLVRVELASGLKKTLVTTTNLDSVDDLAVHDGFVYYSAGKQILRVDAASGGKGEVVASDAAASSLDVGSGYLSWAGEQVEAQLLSSGARQVLAIGQVGLVPRSQRLQFGGADVYWVSQGIHRASPAVASPQPFETVVSDEYQISAFALALPELYFATGTGAAYAASTSSSSVVPLARGLIPISSVAVDDSHAYFSTGQGKVFAVDR